MSLSYEQQIIRILLLLQRRYWSRYRWQRFNLVNVLKCKQKTKNARKYFTYKKCFLELYFCLKKKRCILHILFFLAYRQQLYHLPLYCFRTCGRCRGDKRGITMAAIEIFSSSVTYKYKNKIHSCASIVVFLFIVLSLLTPLFIIHNAGGKNISDPCIWKHALWTSLYHCVTSGIWMKNRMHAETPEVHFEYKYLLLAEVDSYKEPIVCSTFAMYKENRIRDHCAVIKVAF